MGFMDTFNAQTEEITKRTGLNAYLVYLIVIVALVLVWVGWFDEYVTMSVGVLLPSYFSLKALASEEKDDDKQWLTYWVVFGLFVIVELFFGYVLRILPFYYVVKLVFIIWLFMPNFQGAAWVYDNILFRFFKSVEGKIDSSVEDLKNRATGKKSS